MSYLRFFEPHVKDLNRSGSQYIGWCPFHPDEGSRRKGFSLEPEKGLWRCFSCGAKGNVFTFFKQLGIRVPAEAKLEAGPPVWQGFKTRKPLSPYQAAEEAWEPTEIDLPGENEKWFRKLSPIIRYSMILLRRSPKAELTRNWLHARGIKGKAFLRLGYRPNHMYYCKSSWGLSEERSSTLWIPGPSLMIPILRPLEGVEVFSGVKFRLLGDRDGEYYLLPGSVEAPLILGDERRYSIVLESELDAYLLWEIAGDLVNVFGLGGATKRPDKAATQLLRQSTKILISLDLDLEGTRQANWWKKQFSNSEAWFLPDGWGKDPGEAVQNGHYQELRRWVCDGIGDTIGDSETCDHSRDPSDNGVWEKKVYPEVQGAEVSMPGDGKTVTSDGTADLLEEIEIKKPSSVSSDRLKAFHDLIKLFGGTILGPDPSELQKEEESKETKTP